MGNAARNIILLTFCECAFAQQRVITTVAGTDWLFPGNGQPAINAPLSGTFGLDVAVDRNGNYFIADAGNEMVMRVDQKGIVDVIAGNGIMFTSGDGGLAVNAGLFQPTAVTTDSNGNVYVAEYGGDVRKITPDGLIHTIAGTGTDGFGGDHGPATAAQLNTPYGIAVDSAHNVYVADTGNNRIRKITTSGIITTYAGNGQSGVGGDGGSATTAQINAPTRIAVDLAGNLYITQTPIGTDVQSGRIRMVDTHGTITTIAGGGTSTENGIPATQAAIFPLGVAVDPSGNNVYIADFFADGIRQVSGGQITTIAGNGNQGFSGDGGPALQAQFGLQFRPGLAVDSSGNVFVADDSNQRIREITAGIVKTVAGNGLFHFSGNGGPATSAALNLPNSVVADDSGNIYLTEPGLNRIRYVRPDGTINVFAGNGSQGFSGDGGSATSASLAFPYYLALDPSKQFLFFSDSFNCRIRSIDLSTKVVDTYAGTGDCTFAGDGLPADQASFSPPGGIDFDSAGELVIADTLNNRVRVVLLSNMVSSCQSSTSCVVTLAGNGTAGFSGDDGPSTLAKLNNPTSVRVYQQAVYIADSNNHRIRKVDFSSPSLTITTVAGNGTADYKGDKGPSARASLNKPSSVAFDSAGNMYIADTLNRVIRVVAPPLDGTGTITTFAGLKNGFNLNDGGPATNANLGDVPDVFVDSSDNVLLTDLVYDRVREVLVTEPSFQVSPTNLAFTAAAGSTPVTQSVNLVGSISGIPFTSLASSSGWLQVSPATGSMPTAPVVTVDPSAQAPGTYHGTVTITAPNANPSKRTTTVSLTVTAPGQPTLGVNPSSMTFPFVVNAAARSRPVSVSNLGGGSLRFTITAATDSGGAWLRVAPSSGTVNAYASTPINITADPTSRHLSPGTYSGTVAFTSTDKTQSIVVPVTITVSAVQQTILIPQTGLTSYAVQGGGPSSPQFFDVLNTGVGQMQFTATASTLSGGNWLAVFPPSGVSDAGSPLVPEVRVDVNPGALKAEIYYGTVQVSAAHADNTPQFVSVILNVLKPGTNIGALVEPNGLIFSGVAGGESPGSRTVTVQSTSANPVTFHSGRVTVDGNNWFTSIPSDGTLTQANPLRIVIQPQIGGLASNVYRGTLTLVFSDGNTRVISLLLVVVPKGTTLPSADTLAAAPDASCSPTKLAPVFTQLPVGFNVPAGFPAQVEVSVVDNCANPMTAGGVTVSFSNGDPALRLTSLKNGTWAGTWIPGTATSDVAVTALAEVPEQNLKGQVTVKGGVATSQQTPVVGSVVNGATSKQALVSPGSIISVLGSQLAQSTTKASTSPLPTNLGGSSILLAGQRAPLFLTSTGQINAVVPYGIAVNTTQQVAVVRGGALSVPEPVNMAAAGPGIFTTNGLGTGQGNIIGNDTGKIADATHPVKVGEAIIIYCTGLGEVSPPVEAGHPAPQSPMSHTLIQPTVTVGGKQAKVMFSGLAPLMVGMNQVNVVVPEGVAAGGEVPVVITSAGQPSNTVTIAVQ